MSETDTNISIPTMSMNTLDEPVHVTILRDFKMIGRKLYHVIIPHGGRRATALRDWDLWGPLLLCLTLAIVLSVEAPDDDAALVFAIVFVIVWAGAAVVTLNAQLLGGTLSFFQSVCVLGYCLFPLVICAIVLLIVGEFWSNIIFRGLFTTGSFFWAAFASVGFMSGVVPPARKAIAVYPVCMFYIVISWMILIGGKRK
eukprot:TRINITY_DN2913_c0_g1_i1.p1 TRINITY_DN2913_c0_g1~~TRINITY_DN2913_c0_g1_i1.p1  ORF type:complete len:217 (-),score=42.38 TRINITY_DN2913_c0_g1_i1:521-1117(-)